jgi:hypothetical protein
MVKADIIISTIPTTFGSIAPWGTVASGATPTYNQTFIDPLGNPYLQSATFLIQNMVASAMPFEAYIYAWNGTAVTGPALFTSPAESVAPSGATFNPITVSNMNVQLTPGNKYIVFYSTIGFDGTADRATWGGAPMTAYTDGEFEFNNSSTLALPPLERWRQFGIRTGFHATPVPEPSSLALFDGIVAAEWWTWHRRRSAKSSA